MCTMEHNFNATLFSLFICLSTFFYPSSCQTECVNAVCPKPLDCHPPKTSVILPNPDNKCCNITECICEGTNSRISMSGSSLHHYNRLFERYANCTLVNGNLEITHIYRDEATNFLTLDLTKHIRSVTGYVIIAKNTVKHIDLSSLRLIRGRTLFNSERSTKELCKFVKADDTTGYALYIYTNNDISRPNMGLESVDLRSLTEITKGDVMVSSNNKLCYVDTIKWKHEIIQEDSQKVHVENATVICPSCQDSCITEGVDDVSRCWGPTEEMCQQYTKSNHFCTNRNVANKQPKDRTCCSNACAGGCGDAGADAPYCYFCNAEHPLNNFGECTQSCPNDEVTDKSGNVLAKDKTRLRYRLSEFCVKKCPDNLRVLEESKTCVVACPEKYYEVKGVCEPCEGDKCAHICYGLDMSLGDLKGYDVVHSGNIGNFSKNCTIIKGSLNFRKTTFNGIADMKSINNSDSHCNITGMSETLLNVFENVEVITGYLSIEYWPLEDLCIFKNLKKIEGLQKRFYNQYSLVIMTDEGMLRELCLNSLEEISSGSVIISKNEFLCTYDVNWRKFLPSTVDANLSKNKENGCRSVALADNKRLCHASEVNWNVTFNSSSQYLFERNSRDPSKCRNCNKNCKQSDGCWGRYSDQCVTCKNFTDYTDANGKFTEKWIFDEDSNGVLPGHNVTTCVKQCDRDKGVYATEDKKCYPCHEQCNKTCSGPNATNCTGIGSLHPHGCKNVHFNGVCQEKCPPTHYANGSMVCLRCDPGCIDGSCTGPEKKYGTNGCTECYVDVDQELKQTIYHGPTCSICRKKLQDLTCGKGCTYQNSTDKYECYNERQSHLWVVPVSIVIVILLVVIAIIWFKCRTTIKTMRKHIGQKLVEDVAVADEFNSPLTPSGTAPNTAQLRIVKQSDLTMGKELGSGAFGAVYKAVWALPFHEHNIKIPVAVKQLKTCSDSNEIMEEAHVMASVDSPYLIRLLGMCMSENVSLITQFMPLGSLLDYVRSNMDTIGSRHMLTWCTQIAKGMQYLENKHMVHRDLAARNVLVKTPHHVKITDFGLSKILDASQSVYLAEGGKLPIKWLAIECITERKFSHQSDVWSFGVTCWEIFTFGTRPYDGVRAVDVLSLLERGDRLKQPPICTIDVYMLLVKCWLVDPLQRPRFSQLVEEFNHMSNDFSRYLVIQNDNTASLLSPNPEDEKQFFERLMQENTMGIDDGLAFEEPDTYLLRPGINDEPEYENQPRVPHHANNGSIGAPSHEMRLFSRNTPSANMPTPQPQSSSNSFARSNSRLRESDSSNPDDVFMNSGHSLQNKMTPIVDSPIPEKPLSSQVRINPTGSSVWFGQNRKDSEESSRYTEDPTNQNRARIDVTKPSILNENMHLTRADGMQYDEEEYLLPTPSTRSENKDYFGSKNETHPKNFEEESPDMGMAISNSVYMDGNEIMQSQQSDPSSWPNQFLSKDNDNDDPLYVNNQVPEHDYLNWNSEDGKGERAPLNPNPETNSVEGSPKVTESTNEADLNYLNPDIMVRDPGSNATPEDDTDERFPSDEQHSQMNNTPFTTENNGNLGFMQKSKINISESNGLNPLMDQDVTHDTAPNFMGLDNPEYMMLHSGTTEKDALLNDNTLEA